MRRVPGRIHPMRVALLSYLAARVPPVAVTPVARGLGVILAWTRPGQARAWRHNVQALGRGGLGHTPHPAAAFAHHLLAHYEAFAMLGGRRFRVAVDGEGHLRSALATGKGLLVATAHVGGWNVGAGWLGAATGLRVHTVAGTQIGRSWTRELRRSYRERGIWIHDREGSTSRLLHALRAGEIVVLHVDGDQHAGSGLALRGVCALARRSGAPVLPGVVGREAGGGMRIRLLRPFHVDCTARVSEVSEAIAQLLRSQRPEQWTIFRPLAGAARES